MNKPVTYPEFIQKHPFLPTADLTNFIPLTHLSHVGFGNAVQPRERQGLRALALIPPWAEKGGREGGEWHSNEDDRRKTNQEGLESGLNPLGWEATKLLWNDLNEGRNILQEYI